MSKKKKTFFGSFLKSNKNNPEPADEDENNKKASEGNGKDQKSVNVSASENRGAESKENSDEEWATDYEGQLTIDVYQTESDIIIKSTIAGVTPEDIDITIDNDMVIIKGERQNCLEVPEDDYYYQECYWGSFSRSVILPCDVEADKIQAELKNGILTVALPKVNKTKTKKISVKAA